MVSTATAAIPLDKDAFAALVLEKDLRVVHADGYMYARVMSPEGMRLYRTFDGTLDGVPEQTAVTSNPAAGVTSVDVKTFTGRGRVTAVACSCVADANVATREIDVYKVSGGLSIKLGASATFVASATGYLITARGYPGTVGSGNSALAHVEYAPGDILRVVVNAGQAGDDLSAITYSFKEAL